MEKNIEKFVIDAIKELINLYIDGKLNMTKSAELIKGAEMGQR